MAQRKTRLGKSSPTLSSGLSRRKRTALSNDLAATVPPRRGVSPGSFFARARDFRFLAPSTRLNAISEILAILGRRRVVQLADFGELGTQKLILRELPQNVCAGRAQ